MRAEHRGEYNRRARARQSRRCGTTNLNSRCQSRGLHLAAEHGVARREWRSRLESYCRVQGWADLCGNDVALCQCCSEAVRRDQLTVTRAELVVCQPCAREAQGVMSVPRWPAAVPPGREREAHPF